MGSPVDSSKSWRNARLLLACVSSGNNAGVVEPHPLGIRGEGLVEPQVGPVGGRDGVAEPLVGQFVRQQADVARAG